MGCISRRAHEEKGRRDTTKSEIVIRVAVRGGPRRCNGARLIRPPAANNILIWRPLAVPLLLPSFSRALLGLCSSRSLSFAYPGFLRTSTGEDCLPAASYTHLCGSSTRFLSLLVTTRFVTHIYACFTSRPAPLARAPLILRGPHEKKIPFILVTLAQSYMLIISLYILF